MPLHPPLEGLEPRLRLGPLRGLYKGIARGDQALELGPLVSAAPSRLLAEGGTPAQDQAHRAVGHFIDLSGKPLRAEHLCLEEPAHLGDGQRGDVAEPCRGQRALAFGLHHAAVTDEDHFGDPKPAPQRVDLRGHGDRIGRVALVHMHGQGLASHRG